MKKRALFLPLLIIATLFSHAIKAENNPVANPKATVTSGDMRFTVLTPEMIRIEWRSGSDKKFEDHATFTVLNRNLPVPDFKTSEDDTYLYIETEKLKLQYRKGSFPGTWCPASSANLKITFDMDGKTVTWYPWKKDALNLKGTCRTLDGAIGDNKRQELEDGLISRSGWSVIDDSDAARRGDGSKSMLLVPDSQTGIDWLAQRADPTGMDWYFMGYGHDYKKALQDYTKIAGRIPMPPLWALGYWYSKYEDYSDNDIREIAKEMKDHNLPCDVMVIDTDWHGADKWTGWSWNKNKFPDPAGFLKELHEEDGFKVTLNLHPAYGIDSDEDNFAAFKSGIQSEIDNGTIKVGDNGNIPWRLDNKKFYTSLFNNILRPHENIGVDFWWLDWQQELTSLYVPELSNTFWCNHVFYEDMRKNHADRRALIFHRWGGLGSHRYQIGFSGDAKIDFSTLAFEPYFTSTASNVGYCWWGHDLGGHAFTSESIVNDPELVLRWIQYGVFSPIFRTHATKDERIERRIWKFDNFSDMLKAVNLRYALIPYIYTMGRKAYDTGVGICRPLYYDYPESNEAYDYEGEYMFGDEMLVSPITKAGDANGNVHAQIWLPKGSWFEACSGEKLEGGNTYTRSFGKTDIPYYFKAGAIVPNYPHAMNLKTRPDNLTIQFVPGADGSFSLYEDENDTEGYRDGVYATTKIEQSYGESESTYTINPIEGSFPGMQTERSYTLQLLFIDRPLNVTVNGKTYNESASGSAGTWKYDEETKTVNVYLPKTKTSSKTVVKAKFQTSTSINEAVASANSFKYDGNTIELGFPSVQKKVSLSIYNVAGALQSSDSYRNVKKVEKSTDTLGKGAYICQVIDGNKDNNSYKFIKQ